MNDAEAREAISSALARIAPEIEFDEADTTEPMTRELDLDSMDMLSLLEAIGERTGIHIPETDVEPTWSIDDMVAYLVAR